jgi:hypothetical protein
LPEVAPDPATAMRYATLSVSVDHEAWQRQRAQGQAGGSSEEGEQQRAQVPRLQRVATPAALLADPSRLTRSGPPSRGGGGARLLLRMNNNSEGLRRVARRIAVRLYKRGRRQQRVDALAAAIRTQNNKLACRVGACRRNLLRRARSSVTTPRACCCDCASAAPRPAHRQVMYPTIRARCEHDGQEKQL